MPEVEFKTLDSKDVKFGKNNFIEIARKKAVVEDGENEFVAISRGFFLPDGTKRYKKSIAIPDQKDIKESIAKALTEI